MAHNDRYRQDHDKMAAGASAELPREREEPEPIPGEHDQSTEPATASGTVGGTGFGSDLPISDVDPTLDDEDRKRIRWESGGRLPKKS
jgi:hypothetical protein